MEKKNIKFNHSNYSATQNLTIEIPIHCSHCGVSNNPVNHHLFNQSFKSVGHLLGLLHKCTGCYQDFFTLQVIREKKAELLTTYPSITNRNFNKLIEDMSPRFVEMYKQSFNAEQLGNIDLAGMGYRASLEVLIKDYALFFTLDKKEDIAKNNLNNVIGKYFKAETGIVAADVVRKLGNDYAHWEKEFSDLSLEILKAYLEIFIKQIEVKLMLKNPPVPTRTPEGK